MKNYSALCLSLILCLTACQPSSDGGPATPKTPDSTSPTPDPVVIWKKQVDTLLFSTSLTLHTKKEVLTYGQKDVAIVPLASSASSPSAMLRARDEYLKSQKKMEESVAILNGAKTGVDYLLTAGTTAAAVGTISLPAAITLKALQDLTLKSLEMGIDEMKNSSEKQAEVVLSGRLKQASQEQIKLFNSLKRLAPESAQAEMLKLTQQWASQLVPTDSSESSRNNLRTFYAQSLAQSALAVLAREGSAQAIINKNTNQRIQEGEKNFLALVKTLTHFQNENNLALKELADSQQTIQKNLLDLGQSVAKNSLNLQEQMDDVEFIRDFTLSQMSPERQLEELQRMRESGKNPRLQRKIEMVEERLKFEASYSKIMNGAQNLLKIGQAFGVDSKALKTLSEGVQAIDIIKNGATAWATGNYLQGVATLSGLMGVGGSSAEDARFRQIMQKLNTIIENQVVMNQKLDHIIEMQKTQLSMLQMISQQIQASTEMIYGKINVLHDDLLGNKALLVYLTNRDLESCEVAAKSIREQGLIPSFYLARNFTWHVEACSLEYDRIFKLRNFTAHFLLTHYKTSDNQERIDAEVLRFLQSLRYLESKHSQLESIFVSLANPSENVFGLLQKQKFLNSSTQRSNDFSLQDHRAKYSTATVLNRLQKMLTVLPAISLINGTNTRHYTQVSDLLDLQKHAGRDEIQVLDGALELVTASIAQENLLSGDALLPLFYESPVFHSLNASEEEISCRGVKNFDHPKCIIRNNEYLFQNFVRYAIYREFKEQGFFLGTYRSLLETGGNVSGIKNFIKSPLNFAWDDQKKIYTITLAGLTFPAPTFEEVAQGNLVFTSNMGDLLALRKTLIENKTQMSLNESDLSKQDIETIYKALLQGR